MHNYAGSPSGPFLVNVRIIDDSDPPNAANLMAGVLDLADRTAVLNATSLSALGGTITGELIIASFGKVTFESASILDLLSGAYGYIEGGAVLQVKSGGFIQVVAGGILDVAGGTISLHSGGAIDVEDANGVQGNVAGAIQGNVASGIQASVPGGIASGLVGGIRLTGGPNDWETFPGRGRDVVRRIEMPPGGLFAPYWTSNPLGLVGNNGVAVKQQCPLSFQHNGARVIVVYVYFAVGGTHALTPSNMPTGEIFAVPMTLNAVPTPVSLTGGPIPFTRPSTGAGWYNTGGLQVQPLALTGAGVVIDTSTNYYYLELVDENGANEVPGNLYLAVDMHFTDIFDMRFP